MAEKIKITKPVEVVKNESVETPVVVEKPKFNFEKISFFTLVITTFLLPFFFLPVSLLGFTQTKVALFAFGTLVSLCFYIGDKIRKGKVSVILSPIYIIGFLLLVAYFISSWFSISQYKSFVGSMTEIDTFSTILTGFVFMFLLGRLARTGRKVSMVLGALFSSVFIAMLVQLLRVFVGPSFSLGILSLPSDTLVGSWGDMTLLSIFVLVSVLVVLETVKLKKWVTIVLSSLLILPFFFVVLSGMSFDFYFFSMGLLTIIAIASIVIFAYLFSLRRAEKGNADKALLFKKKSVISPSFMLLLVAIVVMLLGSPVNLFLSKVTGVGYIEGRPNWQTTYSLTKKVLSERPFFGSGPNTFSAEWNQNKTPDVNNYVFWNNDFTAGVGQIPSFATTTGLVGFILWILFYAFVAMLSWKTLFGGLKSENIVQGVVIALGSIVSVLIALFDSPGFVIEFVGFVFIGLLLAVNQPRFKTKDISFHGKQWQNFLATIVLVILLIVSLYSIYIVAFKAIANYYYRASVLSSDISSALLNIQTAIRYDPTQALYYNTAAQIYASQVASMANLPEADIVAKKDEINSNILNAVSYAVSAENVDPSDYHNKIVTGKILEFFGSLGVKDASQTAIQKYIAASKQTPTNPLPLLFISNIALNTNDKDTAREYLTQAINLKSNYSDVPDLGKEVQALVDALNKTTPVVTEPVATSTSKTKAK